MARTSAVKDSAPGKKKPSARIKTPTSKAPKKLKKKNDDSSEDSADEGKKKKEFKALDVEQGNQAVIVTTQWNLAKLVLGDIEKYEASIASCTTTKKQVAYANKIKNRLCVMAKISTAYDTEMGQTGAGIQHASEIDMNVTNSFTTKWDQIKDVCPWYFDMCNLIAQRPNLVPVGLGHSSTGVSTGVIMPAAMEVDVDVEGDKLADDNDEQEDEMLFHNWHPTPEPPSPRPKRTFSELASNDEDAGVGSGDDYEPSSPTISESALAAEHDAKADENEEEVGEGERDEGDGEPKIKAKGKETHHKNSAKPSKSTPTAAAPAVKVTKKSKLAEFSEIAKSEERTRQKELELTALRTRQAIKATEVKGRVVEKCEDRRLEAERGKREEKMAKLRMKELKMIQSQELCMASRGAVTSHGRTAGTFFDDTRSLSSGSHYGPSEPPGYAARFDFNFSENAAAGPSSAALTSANQDFTLPIYNPDHEDESSLAFGAYLGR
ncbi:hypothetical protein C8R44DRAFT_871028 [Mycena epipterygia]|nr:hypothetical protein C8R44DRAFT_871028 [Mycena epipterygia]